MSRVKGGYTQLGLSSAALQFSANLGRCVEKERVGNGLLFQWLAYCFPVISHMTGNRLLGKFSPKHFTLSPEQEKKWLDWDEQLARTISLEVTPPLAIKADDTKKQTQKFCLSGDCSSPISYDE
ncbi:hypothetical protein PAL_GLEAN10006518 [Pteropus alecto]|uniref:Uncharacterized protein n=1 Tax=Pteropus alecto TaxID=9402 RepID=L5L2W0_PTEAL|nr:hypothetical protein PAL_GLEAN10006518 [Pteropus alecto]